MLVYNCQNATLLEITCHCSNVFNTIMIYCIHLIDSEKIAELSQHKHTKLPCLVTAPGPKFFTFLFILSIKFKILLLLSFAFNFQRNKNKLKLFENLKINC